MFGVFNVRVLKRERELAKLAVKGRPVRLFGR
jgi:hypothetical protein